MWTLLSPLIRPIPIILLTMPRTEGSVTFQLPSPPTLCTSPWPQPHPYTNSLPEVVCCGAPDWTGWLDGGGVDIDDLLIHWSTVTAIDFLCVCTTGNAAVLETWLWPYISMERDDLSLFTTNSSLISRHSYGFFVQKSRYHFFVFLPIGHLSMSKWFLACKNRCLEESWNYYYWMYNRQDIWSSSGTLGMM